MINATTTYFVFTFEVKELHQLQYAHINKKEQPNESHLVFDTK